MVKNELIKRSPLRILEKTIHGGVGAGNIGVIASRKGVGKTACLVHIATDKLFQGKHVIHVSFSSRTDHIVSWYEDIFREIAKKRELESAVDIHDEIIKNRVIMNFNQSGVKISQVLNSVKSMIKDGHFSAESVVIDGFDFLSGTPDDIALFKKFAEEEKLELWFTATLSGLEPKRNAKGIPDELESYLDMIAVLVYLKPMEDHISLQLVKDHGTFPSEPTHLMLDTRTLLIVEE